MKGMLFKPWKIQFIAEHPGMEIMTRRVIKPQPLNDARMISACGVWSWEFNGEFIGESKPRYQQGETVYLKEKALYWVSPILEGVEYDKPSDWWTDCVYQDDPEIPALLADNGRLVLERSINQIVEGSPTIGKWEWKSGMFMPEHYARHFIKIVAVRAERLQEITEDDCVSEGYPLGNMSDSLNLKQLKIAIAMRMGWYRTLWNSINKNYQWESNPFVFPYTFRLEARNGN